jgi:RNA polymerase sigma-70 factor (ECF subfamily)
MMGAMATGRVEAAYRRTHERLWRSLLAFGRDPELASDAEAEAFAQALRRGDAVDDVERWVWRAAFRIAAGMLAARRREPDGPAIEHVLDASTVEFLSLLGGLSDQQRSCVVLRYVGGLMPTEIADVLGTTSGSVRVQLHRAHAALRSDLERTGGI